jgi:hypothetical protein
VKGVPEAGTLEELAVRRFAECANRLYRDRIQSPTS